VEDIAKEHGLLDLTVKLEKTLETIHGQQLRPRLLRRPLRVVLPELHATSGRIDARKIAEFLDIKLTELCKGLDLNYSAVHKSSDSVNIQSALQPVKRSLEILQDLFENRDTIRAWLNVSHPELGMTPLEAILSKKSEALQGMLENALEGIPP
jgi:hypothetical protein